MLDKIMAQLMLAFDALFAWWADLTGTEARTYEWFGKRFGVNWPIVTFVFALWAIMLVIGLVRWIF